ncbi:MAG: hypothetical protein ACKVW3_12185 [Phycisphaerales bacterium]
MNRLVAAVVLVGVVLCLLPACATRSRFQGWSLLNRRLDAPQPPTGRRQSLEADLARAEAALAAAPRDEDAAIWRGRRLAYLGRYREAIDAYSLALVDHPASYRLLRHRGHRWITLREFDRATDDLARAADLARGAPDEIEPDGAPNPANRPRSTTQSNIYYHLGLAHYLSRRFAVAHNAYLEGLPYARVNDDMLVATTYWLYLTNRRLGHDAEAAALLAAITPTMEIMENSAYHRLLLLFKGEITPEEVAAARDEGEIADATIGYGLGMYWWLRGDRKQAEQMWRGVLRGPNWVAFGFIAAEVEIARLQKPR